MINEIKERSRPQAVYDYCKSCRQNDNPATCDNSTCPLFEYRSRRVGPGKSRSSAIIQHCTDCCCGSSHERVRCHIKDCELWAYRNGSPSRMGTPDEPEWDVLANILRISVDR